MSSEPAIIDTTVIQVKSTTLDNFGNLIVSPEVGEDVKISEKRNKLFDIFQQGRAVKLYWAEYMHKKYVARAELFDGKPPVEKQVESITTEVKQPFRVTDSKNRAFALSYAKDIACAMIGQGKEIGALKVIEAARVFEKYLEGKEVQPAKSKLVDEAKKLGAKEIGKEDDN